jgi:hypothetical protein
MAYQVKVKLSLYLTKYLGHENILGSGGVALLMLNLGPRWRRVVSFTSRPLYPWYPLYRSLVGSQSRSGHDSEDKEKYSLPLLGIETVP